MFWRFPVQVVRHQKVKPFFSSFTEPRTKAKKTSVIAMLLFADVFWFGILYTSNTHFYVMLSKL